MINNKKQPILVLKNISKHFGHVKALDNVNFELYPNEILALIGDNGAGKSTLIKIISGALKPNSGEIYHKGKRVEFGSPKDAKNLGIETVYQDLAIIDSLNVYSNVFLGREIIGKYLGGLIRILKNRDMENKTKEMIKDLEIDIKDVRVEVENLSGGQKQATALAKTIFWGKEIVILDEPTAALGVRESKNALELIKRLKEKYFSVIIITHNLQHAFYIADRIVVLRHGKRVGSKMVKETNPDEIVKMITGAELVVV